MAEKKDLSFIRHPDFRYFYAIGAVGTWTAHDFRINFYSEKVNDDEGEALVNDVQIILPPRAVRDLAVALARNIKEYERTYGVSLKNGAVSKEIESVVTSDIKSVKSKGKLKTKSEREELLGPDFEKDLKKDLKKDITKDLRQDLKKDLKQDLEKGFKQDLKKDLKQDLEKGFKQDLKKEVRTEVRGVIKETKITDQKRSKEKRARSKLTARGRRKVGRGRKSLSK
jgi:hypothetical protein